MVKEKVFRYLLCDMGIGDIKKEVTNGDIGGGGGEGVTFGILTVTSSLNRPLRVKYFVKVSLL